MFLTYCYGGERFSKPGVLSVLSILARLPAARIDVYTDAPASFSGLSEGVRVHPLSPIDVAAGCAPVGYRHRVKIAVLLRHALSAEEGSPVIYTDTDTYFKGLPGGVAPDLGARPWVMHNLDGLVGDDFYPAFNRFLLREAPRVTASEWPGMTTGFKMFNSGLIGFRATRETARLLVEAQRLTDWLCVNFHEQPEWTEQFALAWIGEQKYGVEADAMGFHHYWNQNTEVSALLSAMSRADLAAIAGDEDRFAALLADAAALSGDPKHRRTVLRKKRWNRSLQKRLIAWRGRKLR
ncbi:hypothetical protein SAMN05444156_1211 [Verrucomicrobium sp. GAS474]|uniref:hypothetical protein n=1 Tax=Verrucomicrobium sp. GAS474 TaxID=1882831 RepID=UPI00087A488D|nr:hypothetical protein [Verrucomicrobium sp. GAS474]SDT97834.1 hypothetical protein SAMN05444156_1211 [Verrucomicrobium sp. GAS474]